MIHGVTADFERIVFAVNTKSVQSDRLKHGIALHPFESPIHIAAREGIHVPDMQTFGRRIRKHHQIVKRFRSVNYIGYIEALLVPRLLPFGFNLHMIVSCFLLHELHYTIVQNVLLIPDPAS